MFLGCKSSFPKIDIYNSTPKIPICLFKKKPLSDKFKRKCGYCLLFGQVSTLPNENCRPVSVDNVKNFLNSGVIPHRSQVNGITEKCKDPFTLIGFGSGSSLE